MKRICSRCKKEKSLELFIKDKRRPLGFGYHCKECDKNRVHDYYFSNKPKEIQRYRKYRENHREKGIERNLIRRYRLFGNNEKISAQEWIELKEYYSNTCLCCKRKEPEIHLELDHIIPVSKGGRNVIENAQPLCRSCNRSKYDKHINYRFIPVKTGV